MALNAEEEEREEGSGRKTMLRPLRMKNGRAWVKKKRVNFLQGSEALPVSTHGL